MIVALALFRLRTIVRLFATAVFATATVATEAFTAGVELSDAFMVAPAAS